MPRRSRHSTVPVVLSVVEKAFIVPGVLQGRAQGGSTSPDVPLHWSQGDSSHAAPAGNCTFISALQPSTRHHYHICAVLQGGVNIHGANKGIIELDAIELDAAIAPVAAASDEPWRVAYARSQHTKRFPHKYDEEKVKGQTRNLRLAMFFFIEGCLCLVVPFELQRSEYWGKLQHH